MVLVLMIAACSSTDIPVVPADIPVVPDNDMMEPGRYLVHGPGLPVSLRGVGRRR